MRNSSTASRISNLGHWLRRGGLACVMFATALSSGPALAAPRVIYRETFGYCTGTVGKDAAVETGWFGVVGGFAPGKVSNLKVFSYGHTDIGGSVNSAPRGFSQGYGFWFRPVYALTVMTSEFAFDVGLLKNASSVIEYQQRLSGVNLTLEPNKTRLALLIDDSWYISNEYVAQVRPGVWEAALVIPSALTYGVVPLTAGNGPIAPTTYASPLPTAGTVRAFGLFMDEVNGRVRIDNFVIKAVVAEDAGFSTSVQETQGSVCPAGSPDRSGDSGGQEPPSTDDGDTQIDQNIPEPFLPRSVPTPDSHDQHPVSHVFCPVKQQGRGRAVSLSAKAYKQILRKIGSGTQADWRDRAIFAILGQRAMPIGALVNVSLRDYDVTKGVLSLSTRPSGKPLKLRLKRAAREALTTYLSFPDAPADPAAPLFLTSLPRVQHATSTQAACYSEIISMARTRARAAKASVAGITGAAR